VPRRPPTSPDTRRRPALDASPVSYLRPKPKLVRQSVDSFGPGAQTPAGIIPIVPAGIFPNPPGTCPEGRVDPMGKVLGDPSTAEACSPGGPKVPEANCPVCGSWRVIVEVRARGRGVCLSCRWRWKPAPPKEDPEEKRPPERRVHPSVDSFFPRRDQP
jgi:hypothetical protein